MAFRLEPTPRAPGIEQGLTAGVYDPLWLLCRQWQFGEFKGDDAGTPAIAHLTGATAPLTHWRGQADASWNPYDPSAMPLDAVVEPEGALQPDPRLRLEAGVQFLTLLSAQGVGKYGPAFAAAHPFVDAAPFASDPMLAAIAARTPDPLALLDTARAFAEGKPASVTVDPGDLASVAQAAQAWLAWFVGETTLATGSGTDKTWDEHRLEYGFAVASPAAGGTVLQAPAYRGDGIDWYDFEIAAGPPPAFPQPSAPLELSSVPTPVSFGGMPAPRFWQMEDALSDLGAVDAAGHDLGRLLLVEFATVYGNDWFVLPIRLPSGSLTTIDSLVVTDVFARRFLISRAGTDDPNWNLFSLATDDGSAHAAQQALLLPPALSFLADGSPVEQVLFLRDEVASLAWAVERLVEDGLGGSLDRRSAWVAGAGGPAAAQAAPDPSLPAYIVETIVPDYWVPLAPEQLADQQSVRLRLVPMEAPEGGTVDPVGRVLSASDASGRLWLYEEEVPRAGVRVSRLPRYARWHDGTFHLWTARRTENGRGEGSSGLRFDTLDPG